MARSVSIVHIFNNALRVTEILIHQTPDSSCRAVEIFSILMTTRCRVITFPIPMSSIFLVQETGRGGSM